ncbi:MAG: hypothetical protein R3E42_03760 [Burkholderiaceae bacterium]
MYTFRPLIKVVLHNHPETPYYESSVAAANTPNLTAALRYRQQPGLEAMFFLPVEIAGKTTILFDHTASWLATQQRPLAIAFVLALMAWGAASPFVSGRWRESTTTRVFSAPKVPGPAAGADGTRHRQRPGRVVPGRMTVALPVRQAGADRRPDRAAGRAVAPRSWSASACWNWWGS